MNCTEEEPYPDNKVHGANMGPIWGRQDPGGPNVGPMNFATWGRMLLIIKMLSNDFLSDVVSRQAVLYHINDHVVSIYSRRVSKCWKNCGNIIPVPEYNQGFLFYQQSSSYILARISNCVRSFLIDVLNYFCHNFKDSFATFITMTS